MSARPIATANISFGLVSVPVKLYSSSESSAGISFNWLDPTTGSRVKQQYFSPTTGEVLKREDLVKGYEFAKDQYVQFAPEELKALDEKATNSIDISEFVPLSAVDRVYLDKTYYLGPDKRGERPYRLLAKALEKAGRAALGQYAARGRQYLILVRSQDGMLIMEQLHYASEVRPASEVPIEDGDVKSSELDLATQLIEQTATDEFHPEQYRDTVHERVLEAIEGKVQGEEIISAPAEEPQTQIIDLMAALKASLAKKGEGGGEKKEAKGSGKKSRSKKAG